MRFFRLCNSAFADDLSGQGAAMYPGRWNRQGTAVLYCSEGPEIALLEILVNLPPMMTPELTLLTLEIPEDSVHVLSSAELPANWFHLPAPTVLALIGQEWIQAATHLALQVPSAVVHSANNVILNTRHPLMAELRVISKEPFYLDRRLIS
jgi:RES domain-containing protein